MATVARIVMNMGIQRIMTTDPKLLTLVHWLSPSYPIGSFAWSHGIEAAIAQGWIEDDQSLKEWLTDLVQQGSIRNDAILISLAYGTTDYDTVRNLNATARALAASKERIREAERQGAAFAKTTREVWKLNLPDLMLPVALGYAARLQDLDGQSLTAIYAQSVLSNLVLAAQRLMALGQTSAQTILLELTPLCAELSQDVAHSDLDDIYSNCFLSDVASMVHETQQPRLFQS